MTPQISPNLQLRIDEKIAELHRIAAHMPGVIIVHSIPGFRVEYMSEPGLANLDTTIEKLRAMGMDYYAYYFNDEDAADYIPKVAAMIGRNSFDEQVSFFQQVRRFPGDTWSWYFSTTRLFLQDEAGQPLLTITTALPIDPLQHVTAKVSRLLDETNFVRSHQQRFESLTEREREVLRLLAMSFSAAEIADRLVISVHTVETHRKNLRKKLQATTAYEINRFASAFNLI
ncbi:response regulator transcription factor [Taibaiella koreensis]|uniref:response regulator transcription factor n=1 Tax=Taibaiella koreensis TaxID=1268548 RepID=UPI000E59D541|nr:helix-turn-helix transcriptional regulator [Taibaiella koreensis]